MKFKQFAVLTLSSAVLVGCASKPPKVVDNSPLIRTAVVTSTIKNSGIKGFFGNQTDRSVSVMDQITRVDNQVKYTGSVLGRLSKKQSVSDIIRLDRNLEWNMDNRAKTYRECPIGGCLTTSAKYEALLQDDGFESDEQNDIDESCQITITENTFTMAPTGAQRLVNGYDSTEHALNWTVRGKDPEGKTFHSEISVINWMTPITGDIAEAVSMHNAFNQNYQTQLKGRFPLNTYQVIPADTLEVFFKAFTAGMSEVEANKLLKKFEDLQVPEGYSVSNKFTWDARNETCAEPEEPEQEEEDKLNTGSLTGLLASVGKQVIKQEVDKKKKEKAREIALRPVFSVLTDVKAIEIRDIRESQLSVPAKFKLLNRS